VINARSQSGSPRNCKPLTMIAREAMERHRAQATQVFMTLDYTPIHRRNTGKTTADYGLTLRNTSAQPVYEVVIRWFQRTAPWSEDGVDHERLPRLMPDQVITLQRDLAARNSNLDSYGAVVEFRDAAGFRWRTTKDGRLEELPSLSG
jgi:hypothetical protein